MLEHHAIIILVDQDATDRSVIAYRLRHCAYRVVEAEDAREALDLLEVLSQGPLPILVVCLLGELCRQVLSADEISSSPVSVIAYCRDSEQGTVAALQYGAKTVVANPLNDAEPLCKAITDTLYINQLEKEHGESQMALKRANEKLQQHIYMLERDQAAGRLVQEKLAPPSPLILSSVALEYAILPSLYLSGDAIDYGLLSQRYVAFYLTDIAGHGAASAFVTVWVRQLVRSTLKLSRLFSGGNVNIEDELPALFKVVNESLLKAKIGSHLTCFVGIIDTENRELAYCVGGHLPMPVLYTVHECRVLAGEGKALGIFERAQWQVYRTTLPSAFRLLVCSDGMLELQTGADLCQREQRFFQTIEHSKPANIEQVMNAMSLSVQDEVPDDVAMLLIKDAEPGFGNNNNRS